MNAGSLVCERKGSLFSSLLVRDSSCSGKLELLPGLTHNNIIELSFQLMADHCLPSLATSFLLFRPPRKCPLLPGIPDSDCPTIPLFLSVGPPFLLLIFDVFRPPPSAARFINEGALLFLSPSFGLAFLQSLFFSSSPPPWIRPVWRNGTPPLLSPGASPSLPANIGVSFLFRALPSLLGRSFPRESASSAAVNLLVPQQSRRGLI